MRSPGTELRIDTRPSGRSEALPAHLVPYATPGCAVCAQLSEGATGADPRCELRASQQGVVLAALLGATTHSGFRALHVLRAPGHDEAAAALLSVVPNLFPGQRSDLDVCMCDATTPLRFWLERGGAPRVREDAHYVGPVRADGPDPFTWLPYTSVGKGLTLALLADILSGPAEQHPMRAAVKLLDEAIFEATGPDGLRAEGWRIATLDGLPVAVALAQLHGDGRGSLRFMGIVPSLRGRGLARPLHAAALRWLAAAGAHTYEDATAIDNVAARRTLEGHGAHRIGASARFLLRGEPDQGWLGGPADLHRYLTAASHRVSESGGGWQADVEIAAARAEVTLVWDADAQVLLLNWSFPGVLSDMQRAIAVGAASDLNARLLVPGFVIAPTGPSYRFVVHLDADGGVPVHALRRALSTVVQAAAHYGPWWERTLGADRSLVARVPVRG